MQTEDSRKKNRRDRYDGWYVSGLDSMHVMMPYMFGPRTKNEAVMSEVVDLTEVDKYLEKKNKPYDRLIYSLEEVSSELGCVIICKDSRSTVYKSGEKTYYLNTSGNDGMATAGSGDVLTGITAAFLYAAGSAFEAACAAAYIHGKAGDQAAQRLSKAGMIASDIIDELPHLLLL